EQSESQVAANRGESASPISVTATQNRPYRSARDHRWRRPDAGKDGATRGLGRRRECAGPRGPRKIQITSVGGVDGAGGQVDRLGETATDRSENEGRDRTLRRYGEAGSLTGKFGALVETHAGFFQEFGRETHVFGAVHAPKPELFLVALEE